MLCLFSPGSQPSPLLEQLRAAGGWEVGRLWKAVLTPLWRMLLLTLGTCSLEFPDLVLVGNGFASLEPPCLLEVFSGCWEAIMIETSQHSTWCQELLPRNAELRAPHMSENSSHPGWQPHPLVTACVTSFLLGVGSASREVSVAELAFCAARPLSGLLWASVCVPTQLCFGGRAMLVCGIWE